ncbi:hypothetical protein DFQ28_009030 [Apophysomyces sp. BC1034]|nr:hypothetical protein DFQ28_009030 [Apophysomyces sp. BC1034]
MTVQKKKHDLIHKATVKGQYYKTLAKEDQDLATPDYVKEIFGERTIDEDGNVVKYQNGTKDNKDNKSSKGNKRKVESDDDRVFDLDNPSSDEEEEEAPKRKKSQPKDDEASKRHKPNPFKAQLDVRKLAKEELQKERAEKQRKFEEQKKAKEEYLRGRRRERSKMLAKNKKGQPNMATQMDVLLEKIKKQTDN